MWTKSSYTQRGMDDCESELVIGLRRQVYSTE